MGKFTKQAENIRRSMEKRVLQIKQNLDVDAQKKLLAVADNMGVRVIQELLCMPFWQRLRFACILIFAPVIRFIKSSYKRVTHHAKEETTPSDPS